MKKWTKEVKFTYKMFRDAEETERQFTLPISAERYAELTNGLTPGNKAWLEIQSALETLVSIQGYDNLGAWNVELEVRTEDD